MNTCKDKKVFVKICIIIKFFLVERKKYYHGSPYLVRTVKVGEPYIVV